MCPVLEDKFDIASWIAALLVRAQEYGEKNPWGIDTDDPYGVLVPEDSEPHVTASSDGSVVEPVRYRVDHQGQSLFVQKNYDWMDAPEEGWCVLTSGHGRVHRPTFEEAVFAAKEVCVLQAEKALCETDAKSYDRIILDMALESSGMKDEG